MLDQRNSLIESNHMMEKASDKNPVAAQIDIIENPEEAKDLNQPYQEVTDFLLMWSEFLERKNELMEAFEAQQEQLGPDEERDAKFIAGQIILGASIVNLGGQSPREKISKLIQDGV